MFLISVLITLVILGALYQLTLPPKQLRHLPRVPFYRSFLAILKTLSFEGRYEIYKDLLEKEGICIVWIFGRWVVYLSREEDVQTVLNDSQKFEKQLLTQVIGNTIVGEFFGDNIVYSNGKDWRKHRRAINQFFKKKWDAKLLVDQCIKFCNKVREISRDGSEKINPHILTEKLTLDMLGKLVFDIDFKELEEQHSKAAELYLQSMIIVNKPLYVIFPFLDRFRPDELKIVKEFDDMIESYIIERKGLLDGNKIDPENDALTALVNTSSENVPEDYRLTYKEMLWTFKILFVAGHDTTSMSLSGLLYHLAIYPEIQDKVRKEIQSNIKDIDNISEEELKKLPYLEMVIKENLRLLPPLAINLERISKSSVTFQNYFLPPNTLLQTHFYHLMRSETHWKNPLEFIPERFQDCTMGQLKSWLPFSTGSRSCLGINLSLLEQKIFLVVILNQFRVVWPSDIKNHTLKFGHIDLLYPTNLKLILESLN